jgi:hypothetical protein
VSLKSIMIPLVCDFPILRGIMRHKYIVIFFKTTYLVLSLLA